MKIAVTSTGEDPSCDVGPRFGRCRRFLVFTQDLKPIHMIRNDGRSRKEGAGIGAARTLSRIGVKVLITGNIGPKALESLESEGIEVFIGASGTVEHALSDYSGGKLERVDVPTIRGSG